jgi:hypothetical protein
MNINSTDSTFVEEILSRPRGPIERADGRICIGRVGAPGGQEATSECFTFWVPPDALVEKTQLVACESRIAGQDFTFYALIEEVHRSSRKRNMGHEVDEADGDLTYEPPFASEGCTWATAAILRTEPAVYTPPRERSDILLATRADAEMAYRTDEVEERNRLQVGLIKNGGSQTAGPGTIDLAYLLGENGGHMNVNGAAGRGTKSSFLLFINYLLLNEARRRQKAAPSDENRLRVVPIILNVKNYDLFHMDRRSSKFKEEHLADWKEIGIEDPQAFQNVTYYAAQMPTGTLPVPTSGRGDVKPYSWSLRNVIEEGLLAFLFSESDAHDANFGALVMDIENLLTHEKLNHDGSIARSLNAKPLGKEVPNFNDFKTWVYDQCLGETDGALRGHVKGTWRKFYRRLLKLMYDGKGVLRLNDDEGNPLKIVAGDTCDPIVVDLNSLSARPELQRFVVATILRQLVEARTGTNAVKGLIYLVTLDELNRFAPRGARDPITQLVELVAAEMRSQGVILLGAQQQASKVSDRVIENCGLRVIGKSGSLELSQPVWSFLSQSARRKAENLLPTEKLIVQDNFREPMHIRVPFPAWAMNPNEAISPATIVSSNGPHANGVSTNGASPNGASPVNYNDIFDD